VEGHRLGRVRVTFSGGATTEAHVGRVDGQDRWTLSVMVTTSGNDDPWGGRSGPLPFAADSDEAAIEKYIAYPEGAVSARLWYRHEEGPTMVVDLDHENLEAGYQDQLDEYNHYGMGDHPRNELFIDSDRVSLGSGVLLKGSLTS